MFNLLKKIDEIKTKNTLKRIKEIILKEYNNPYYLNKNNVKEVIKTKGTLIDNNNLHKLYNVQGLIIYKNDYIKFYNHNIEFMKFKLGINKNNKIFQKRK